MIQLNLLPAVKQEYIKAQHQRRLMISISVLVSGLAIAILVVLLFFNLFQKNHLKDLNTEITNESQTLKSEPNINTILTVQNQLESLTTLHAAKPDASKLVSTYLNELTPASVAITNLHVDFTQNLATITGTSNALSSINQYIDTFKKTTYTTNSNKSSSPAFSNVVLSSYGLTANPQDPNEAASYTITLNFDKNIFNNAQNATLSVPSITTRADINQPTDLFTVSTKTTTSTSGSTQ
jgi:hypothetical protein